MVKRIESEDTEVMQEITREAIKQPDDPVHVHHPDSVLMVSAKERGMKNMRIFTVTRNVAQLLINIAALGAVSVAVFILLSPNYTLVSSSDAMFPPGVVVAFNYLKSVRKAGRSMKMQGAGFSWEQDAIQITILTVE